MKFKPGDKVVCVDFETRMRDPQMMGIKPGQKYTVLSVNTQHNNICIDLPGNTWAHGGHTSEYDDSGKLMASRPWNADRFEKAEEIKVQNTVDDTNTVNVPTIEAKKARAKRVGLSTKSLAKRNLVNAEDLFLRAFGWKKRKGGLWQAPNGYTSASVTGPVPRRHAINSQVAK